MKIYCDYDGTLNTLDFAWINWINKTYNTNFTLKDVKHWDWIEENFGSSGNDFWKNSIIYDLDIVKPFDKAIFFIKQLQKIYGKDNISIITHSYPGTEKAKDSQIAAWFEDINIIHAEDKSSITNNGILIDDRPCSVAKHCKLNNQYGIVFTNNDQYGWAVVDPVLDDWEQIKDKIYFLKSYDDILYFLKGIKNERRN